MDCGGHACCWSLMGWGGGPRGREGWFWALDPTRPSSTSVPGQAHTVSVTAALQGARVGKCESNTFVIFLRVVLGPWIHMTFRMSLAKPAGILTGVRGAVGQLGSTGIVARLSLQIRELGVPFHSLTSSVTLCDVRILHGSLAPFTARCFVPSAALKTGIAWVIPGLDCSSLAYRHKIDFCVLTL